MRSRTLRRAARQLTVLLALGLSLLCFGATSAHAAQPVADSVPFEWTVPEGCPARAEVLDGLSQLLDADATSWDRFEVVRGRVTRAEVAFELELEFVSGRRIERRAFATRDCADLVHAAAVALALVLDPAWDWGDREAMPAPDQTKSGAPSEADTGVPRGASETPANVAITFELGPEGVIDTTTLGRSAFGLGLLARARTSLSGTRFSADLFGTWLPGQRIDVRPTESVVLGLASTGIRACNWPTLVLGLCAEIEAGRLSASGIGENAGREALDAWVAPGGSVVLETRLVPGLLLDSRVSLLAPLTRPKYFVNQTEGVHEVPPVAVRVALGLVLTGK